MDERRMAVNNSNMPSVHRPPQPSLERAALSMPAYALYGEARQGAPFDLLHVESIAARSRLHGWEIRPHRHDNLCQLLVVRRGQVQAQLDGQALSLRGPAVVTVPPLAAHGFRFSDDVDGLVFTVVERHLRSLSERDPALAPCLLRLRATALAARAPATRALLAAAEQLRVELQAPLPWRAAAVDAALLQMAVAVLRAWPNLPATATAATAPGALPSTPGARAQAHVQGLRTLVDAQFRSQPGLPALAAPLGITTTQLNRACRLVLGHPALSVLHARLLLEGQRELAYTTLSVKDIALGLGFCEAGYFARFFRRATGLTPSQWRVRALAQAD